MIAHTISNIVAKVFYWTPDLHDHCKTILLLYGLTTSV
jgi:hypothetical protein